MQPNLLYVNVITLTLLSLLSLGMAYPDNKQVSINTRLRYNSGEKAQALPKNNQLSEIERLNEEAIKESRQGQSKEALQRLQQALAMARELGDRSWEAVTFNNIGRIYQSQRKYPEALQSYQEALLINRELGDLVRLGKTYSNIGYLFDIQNKPELAIFFYKHCLINREKARLNPSALSALQPDAYSITVSETYRILGERLLKQERVAEAQRTIDLLKVEELEEYLQTVPGNQRTVKGINIAATEKPIKQKLDQTVNSAVVLGKELTTLRKISPKERSLQQKQRIEQLVLNQQQLLDKFNEFINSPSVKAQIEQISRTARRQNLDLENLNELRDNLARLPQKSAILYPLILKDSLELVLVTPESPPIHRTVAVKRENLYQTIAAFRQALINPSRNIKAPARQLYDWLIKPIEKDLKLSGTQTLIYAPDDQLRYIPLTALYDGKQWLVQRLGVNHITSASLTNLNSPQQSTLRVLAGAFTKGNYQIKVGNRQVAFAGLPFATREVESLAATIPATTKLLDDAFNPRATVPQMDDYTIVHLATHAAFVVGKPEDSFILFGNGDRVNFRNVATWSLPNVDLVVLSACETGLGGKLGNGEEILGFGYQMQQTGARAAIASLWSVDDGGTQALMSAFYGILTTDKLTKTETLRQAQVSLITGDWKVRSHNVPVAVVSNFSHPYYWASFILIGNGL
ncbi:CHAT domain-containing protein [Nostoc sp. UCD121]|uniref:CHAT domain-containing protein n=1 Tax=unclassified Nostoc TaxID=2593658 RepID=UPI00162AA03F|nr:MULTISPECIES: CHAT domain-containing protein [unclassified Nostoc]MBC1218940.1 CHAT domain-containing protein [Nostoc sp. UCD120]MBC1279821.1 CHAT domain-containing protein [Nostoc sp. UCD121]MBC1293793.1 CHAT domain-containing protein [Nostoc sp. UCD122]